MSVLLKKEKIKGRDVEIMVETDGTFYADVNGEKVENKDIGALVRRIGVMLAGLVKPAKIHKLESPSWKQKGPDKFVEMLLTGIHSSNGNMLITNPQTKQSFQSYSRDTVYVFLTEEQQEERIRLQKAMDTAQKLLDAWDEKYELTTERAQELLGLTKVKGVK